MIHIYYGDGKGKTTAAAGLAIRAAGTGMSVLFIQFMKDGSSSEVGVLESVEGIETLDCRDNAVFTWLMTEDDRMRAMKRHEELLKLADERAHSGMVQMVVMDELVNVMSLGLIDKQMVYKFMDAFPEASELVLTGRNPDEELIERCDYASEIRKVHHPYDRGIDARKGIEY